ncbi:sensor histidine kinase [Streptomyces litchfieldiae]|uniref:histidine kinase n=1 Tax=Streptomyces litchfieldiae TaxID=3075543 RepID=A0ABU2MQC0_9ACTN|nr:nitrate- and nitrite sensing domain-containing protein [Streptomyces sp. DSM 44938]MDT0343820.1 nitrate- and nitrite sensing domain-containing protein [Streptomyces sp. DSM 44938]
MGALVLVPLVSLVSVWACATFITVPGARDVRAATAAADSLATPTLDTVLAVQRERRQTMVHLADPRRADELSELEEAQEVTDRAVAQLGERAADDRGALGDGAGSRLDTLLSALDGLEQLRDQVDSSTIHGSGALEEYSRLTEPALRFLSALPPATDADLDRQGRAAVGLALAREFLSQEDALVAAALAAGGTTDNELAALADLLERRDLAYDLYLPDLPVEHRQAHESFWESGTGRLLADMEQSLLEGRTTVVRADQWEQTGSDALDELGRLAAGVDADYRAAVGPDSSDAVFRTTLVAVLGLLAVAVSAFVALRFGRGLDRELRALSREAKDAAELRLPGVMRRLAAGEHVDVETEAPRLEYPPDEVGQVGRALNTLQREAVSAAVERSETRRGVSEVFVNLARRSQVLLHRQLNLLDALQRRSVNADDLADLIRLDHLTTRMRRHAEGLVILSGAAPARQWRKPEQLMDVVRAAVAEVEDYERIEIRRLPPFAVTGGAVADLTHLIAELLENATVFSPPHTAVQVSGERVPHGFTLEIHDRGLGMTAEALREANQRLAETPEFELSDTDRIGHFVVSRLADRHGIRVSLRESPYGGTTAVTLIPGELLTETREEPGQRDPLPRSPARPPLLNGPVDGPVELEAPIGAAGDRGGDHDAHAERLPGPGVEHAAAPDPEDPAPVPRLPQRRPAPVLVTDHGRTVGHPPGTHETPRAAARRDESPEGTTGVGLPRRVRQSAPGGAEAGRAGGHPDTDAEAVPDLDADEVRARMASLQRGWRMGRQQTDTRRDQLPPGTGP